MASRRTTTGLTKSQMLNIEELSRIVSEIDKPDSGRAFLGIQQYTLAKWFNEDARLAEFLLEFDPNNIFRQYFERNGIVKIRSKGSAGKFVSGSLIKTAKKPVTRRGKKVKPTLLKRIGIDSIEIENFKLIEQLTVKFPDPDQKSAPWLMLLGENAVGKSSFLQAVTLALMGEAYRKKLEIDPEIILRHGASGGFVRINQIDNDPIELKFNKKEIQNSSQQSHTYLLGYGSTRLFETKTLRPEKSSGTVRARNLFQPQYALCADQWLLKIYKTDRKKFDFAARALKSLMSRELGDPKVKLDVVNGDVLIRYSDRKRSPDTLKSLSDGFKSVIALACDIMQTLLQQAGTMEIAEGIVLVDEIGTHLHPKWKMRIVGSLRQTFPKLQFIVTTHDPLCLKGLKAGEINVFNKDEDGRIYSVADLPDPGEFSAEQLLASKFFGLSSTVDDEIENDFNEYYALLGKRNQLSVREKSTLNKLRRKLKDKKHLGSSLREELALTAADQILADEKRSEKPIPIEKMKKQTADIVKELWGKPIDQKEKALKP